ncbi:hypothetical protein F511_18349 [Dorcoceras hygrometricum]|uniref:Uncharacterized protein n=1 Tax=Dorcoceras hygrometricum TaxID=472368 RepID=A0A2Z7BTI5_9LAMI|nr:hypothetical protein F511_18349 [Dorcoceras hygrometricum]
MSRCSLDWFLKSTAGHPVATLKSRGSTKSNDAVSHASIATRSCLSSRNTIPLATGSSILRLVILSRAQRLPDATQAQQLLFHFHQLQATVTIKFQSYQSLGYSTLVIQSQYNSSRDWFFHSSTGHSLTSATTARRNTSATTAFPFPPAASYNNHQIPILPVVGYSTDLLSLSTQFADIVEFIHGGDAKKGESGSSSSPPPVCVERRPLPTPQSPRDVAGGSSAVRIPTFPRTTGTFAERVEQARRHLLESGLVISVEEAAERILQADFQESDRFQRERERDRREKRSSSSRRRRGS